MKFSAAISRTVSGVLDVPTTAINNIKIISKNNIRRQTLFTGVYVFYGINITSFRSSKSYIEALEESILVGTFLTSLSNNTGFVINEMLDFKYVDLSPTSSPTDSPVSSLSLSGKSK